MFSHKAVEGKVIVIGVAGFPSLCEISQPLWPQLFPHLSFFLGQQSRNTYQFRAVHLINSVVVPLCRQLGAEDDGADDKNGAHPRQESNDYQALSHQANFLGCRLSGCMSVATSGGDSEGGGNGWPQFAAGRHRCAGSGCWTGVGSWRLRGSHAPGWRMLAFTSHTWAEEALRCIGGWSRERRDLSRGEVSFGLIRRPMHRSIGIGPHFQSRSGG